MHSSPCVEAGEQLVRVLSLHGPRGYQELKLDDQVQWQQLYPPSISPPHKSFLITYIHSTGCLCLEKLNTCDFGETPVASQLLKPFGELILGPNKCIVNRDTPTSPKNYAYQVFFLFWWCLISVWHLFRKFRPLSRTCRCLFVLDTCMMLCP